MLFIRAYRLVAGLVASSVLVAGCGTSTGTSESVTAAPASTGAQSSRTTGGSASLSTTGTGQAAAPGALSAEARSAATGDIPDNQVFLVFRNTKAGYSMKYPEGWTQAGKADDITFKDKNNVVHVAIGNGGAPTTGSVRTQLQALKRSNKTLTFTSPEVVKLGANTLIKARYTTESAPNSATGKRVLLLVDRYETAKNGKVAIVDLGTPRGVDNVDAYRLMITSFTWR